MDTISGEIRVLHVEDEQEFAELTATFLERENDRVSVDTATSAAAGLDRLTERYDCVVSDYDMPGMTGIEFLEAVRDGYPDLPFILFTGKGSEEVASDAIAAGATDYLEKRHGTDHYTLLANRIKNAVRQYRVQRERERTIERVTDAVVRVSEDWQITFVNDQALTLYGMEESAVVGHSFWEVFDDVRDSSVGETYRQVMQRREPTSTETQPVILDGWFHIDVYPNPDGGISFYFHDITGRKESEREAQSRREQLETIFDSVDDRLFLVEAADGSTFRLVEANVALKHQFGLGNQSIRGKTPAELLDAEIAEQFVGNLQTCLERGEQYAYEEILELATGRTTVKTTLAPVRTDGTFTHVAGVTRDITERRERERRLERYRARVEVALRTVDLPTVVLDADGNVVVWNEALERLLGIDREDVEGVDNIGTVVYDGERRTILAEKVVAHPRSADDVYDIERADSEYALLDAPDQPTYEDTSTVVGGSGRNIWFVAAPLYREGEFLGVIEFVQRRADSERQRREMEALLEQLNGTLTAFQEGDYSARVDHDVAEGFLDRDTVEPIEQVNELARMRERLQEQVSEATEAKRELERQNERLEEFAGVVSHDLQNPLNVANLRLELARETCDSPHLRDVAEAHSRMEQLIDDLLTFARAGSESIDRGTVALSPLLEECWDTIRGDDAGLVVETGRAVRADRDRLRQLFENLLSNAVEHGGGDVSITVGDLEGGFYVEDDGPGIPSFEREDVFDTGYSVTDDGTGFGLSIVEQVAEAHGWDIRVTDGSAGGARFEITGVETAD